MSLPFTFPKTSHSLHYSTHFHREPNDRTLFTICRYTSKWGHPILIHVCMCDHDSGGVRACLYRIGMMFIIHSNHWSIRPRSISNHAATLLDPTNYIIKKTRMYTAPVTVSIWFHRIWVACPVNVFWPLAGTHVASDVFECAIRH